jgi:hypothetical protein
LRNARSTETIMLVSRHSRKQMKKTWLKLDKDGVTHVTKSMMTVLADAPGTAKTFGILNRLPDLLNLLFPLEYR